jgi:uncharacterized protein (DUF433 family)
VSDDFENLLGRLDGDDQEIRHQALEELEAVFRESRARHVTSREELRALLDRPEADEAAEFALAEVSNPDPIQARRMSSPAPQMRDDRLIEIETRYLGPLPADVGDHAVEHYIDAIGAIGELVSEVVRLRAAVGQSSATDLGSSNPIDREAGSAVGPDVRSTQSGPRRIRRRPSAEAVVKSDGSSPEPSAVSSEFDVQAANSVALAWGAAVFSGSRVPVDVMFEYLEAGDGLAEFLREFPTVDRTKAVAVLDLARSAVQLAMHDAEPRDAAPSRMELRRVAETWSGRFEGEVGRSEDHEEMGPGATEPVAVGVRFTKRHLWVKLAEGWELRVPIGWFPWLGQARRKQRLNAVITAGGRNLRWPDLDEDLGVALLVQGFARANLDTPRGGRRPRLPRKESEARARRMDRLHDRSWESFALLEGNRNPIQEHRIQRLPGIHMSDDKLADIEASHLGPLPDNLSDQAVAKYLDAIDDIAALVSEIWQLRAEVGPLRATDPGASEPDDRMTHEGAGSAEPARPGDICPPDLAVEFELHLRDLLESWPSKAKENSEWLRELVEVRGGIAAARIWLSLDRRTRMGRKSAVGGHIDAAINGLILGAEFESLFTSRERTIAWHHLATNERRLHASHPRRS